MIGLGAAAPVKGRAVIGHLVAVHAGQDAEVRGVRDAAVQHQHLLVDHRRQGQPAEDLLQQLQDALAVHLERPAAGGHNMYLFIHIYMYLIVTFSTPGHHQLSIETNRTKQNNRTGQQTTQYSDRTERNPGYGVFSGWF